MREIFLKVYTKLPVIETMKLKTHWIELTEDLTKPN